MPRLVNEKNVNRFKVIFLRPKPGGASGDLSAAVQSRKRLRVICRWPNSRWSDFRLVLDLLYTIQAFEPRFIRSPDHLKEQVPDDLVTDRANPHFLSLAHQLADHACAGECLSGSRRPLNREDRTIEQCPDALRGGHSGFIGVDERISPILETRRSAQQKIPRRPVGPLGLNAIVTSPAAETEKNIRHDIIINLLWFDKNGLRMSFGGSSGSS